MPLQDLNLNELRIFATVYRTGGMTSAAQELHLTQSGVSQHISSLETALEVKLFDRLKRKLYPTPAARSLYEACRSGFDTLENTLASIKGGEDTLVGIVRIGMPQEFGTHVLAPLLGAFAQQNPRLRFELQFEYSQFIINELIRGELDIAFVDEFSRHPSVETENVYAETLDLCISKSLLKSLGKAALTQDYFESIPYVDYDATAPLTPSWLRHHYDIKNPQLKYRAIAPATQGVASLITSGMGAGILPRHVSLKLGVQHDLHIFKSKTQPLTNNIALALLKGRTHSQAVSRLSTSLRQQLKSLSQRNH